MPNPNRFVEPFKTVKTMGDGIALANTITSNADAYDFIRAYAWNIFHTAGGSVEEAQDKCIDNFRWLVEQGRGGEMVIDYLEAAYARIVEERGKHL